MRATRTAVLGLAAAAAMSVAGCTSVVDGTATPPSAVAIGSGGPATDSTTSDAPPSTDSAAPGPATDSTASAAPPAVPSPGQAAGGAFPADFPLPPGATISGTSTGALVDLPDPKGAYDFWVSALPAAGYTISDMNGVGDGESFYAAITFSGNGVTTGTIAILGTTGAISLE